MTKMGNTATELLAGAIKAAILSAEKTIEQTGKLVDPSVKLNARAVSYFDDMQKDHIEAVKELRTFNREIMTP